MGEDLSRLLLLLLFAAAFVNVTRGTLRDWLRAKFIGSPGGAAPAVVGQRLAAVTSSSTPTAPRAAGAATVGAAVRQSPAASFRARQAAAQKTWENTNLPPGYSGATVYGAALRYARGRSYQGVPYFPTHTTAEGHIEIRGGVPGVWIKYSTPGYGSSTEWTPLPTRGGHP